MQQRHVCIVSHFAAGLRPGKTRVKFRNPLTSRSRRAANIAHSALYKSTWFAVEGKALSTSGVGLLARISAVVHDSSCVSVQQGVSETQPFRPEFQLHGQIKRGFGA